MISIGVGSDLRSQAILEPWLYRRFSSRPRETATDRWTLYDSASTVGAMWLAAKLAHDIAADRLQVTSNVLSVRHQIGRVTSEVNGEQQSRAAELIQLLEEWMNDESGYDEETWPDLKSALERDRLSSRCLFDD